MTEEEAEAWILSEARKNGGQFVLYGRYFGDDKRALKIAMANLVAKGLALASAPGTPPSIRLK